MGESQYWLGWSAGSWGLSWGYDSQGNAIEVWVNPGGGPDKSDNEDEIRELEEHFQAQRTYSHKVYAKPVPVQVEQTDLTIQAQPVPEPVVEIDLTIHSDNSETDLTIPVSQADLIAAQVAEDLTKQIDERAALLARQRQEEEFLLAML